LRGWSKGESRSVFQTFNLSVLVAALLSHFIAGFLTANFLWACLAALPGTVMGSLLGVKSYSRLSDRRFRQIILILLCLSGALLICTHL
jgi:uncharacterized membrane protein YfcA